MKRPGEQRPLAVESGRGKIVIVREVTVDDLESLPLHGLTQIADVSGIVEETTGAGEQRARPAERQESPGERTLTDEAELRLHSGRHESGSLVENDGRGAGPLLSRDELEDAHDRKL
jgi:hypothetical protein